MITKSKFWYKTSLSTCWACEKSRHLQEKVGTGRDSKRRGATAKGKRKKCKQMGVEAVKSTDVKKQQLTGQKKKMHVRMRLQDMRKEERYHVSERLKERR